MKQILDFFRKIGLLRISFGDYYTGEFDDRKDLKNKVAKGSKKVVPVVGNKKQVGTFDELMILFWILLVAVVVFLMNVFDDYGLSFWFLVFAVFWFFFFKSLKIQIFTGKLLVLKMAIIFVILILFSWIILIPSKNSNKSTQKTFQVEEESLMSVNQANLSSFVFGSKKIDGKIQPVHLVINPLITFSVDDVDGLRLKSFEIKNLKFTKKPAVGEIKIIAPKHRKTDESCVGFYFGGCSDKTTPDQVKDDGEDIIYKVVEQEEGETTAEYYDQILNSFYIKPEFRVVLHNIGKFDYDEVMERDNAVSSGNFTKYAGIKAKDLASVLEFDVVAELSNKEKFKKHFKIQFDGNDLINGSTVKATY